MTTISNDVQRLPAEWEQQSAVLLAWPHDDTDWADMLPEVQACYRDIAQAVAARAKLIVIGPDTDDIARGLAHIDPKRMHIVRVDTNDTWTRDYGAITTIAPGRRPHPPRFLLQRMGA